VGDRISIDTWRRMRKPLSKWRRRAREVIGIVINDECGVWGSNPRVVDAESIGKAIDEAYPFGSRDHHPYKAWLIERSIIRSVLGLDRRPDPSPGPDEAAACEVAIDLVEEGRMAEAEALLDQQAPNRLNRKCPVCGSPTRKPCVEVVGHELVRGRFPNVGHLLQRASMRELLVPHLSRVSVTSGPLFGDRP